MNLPIRARPVMRGHDRRGQDRGHGPPPDAMGRAVEQSALDCNAICALVPAQYKAFCTALCPIFGSAIFH
jgi:hypothetical protein